ncbi:MAG TPA: peptidyl-prolyl cis-trans isomerase [Luteimonas sp.]
MLQKLRDKTSGWIAGTVLGLLTIPFAFFGMEQYMTQRNATWAAQVEVPPQWWPEAPHWWPASMLWEREEIGADEFRTEFEQLRQREREAQGDAFDTRAFATPEKKREVLDQMVDRKLMELMADRTGIAIGDAMVRNEIQSIPAFQTDGRFDPQQYQLVLASQVPQRSPTEFEQLVREDLQRTLIPAALSQSAFATKTQLDRVLRLVGETRDVSFAILPAPEPDTGAVGAAEIQAWYDAHKAEFRAPETVQFEYVEIDGRNLQPAPAGDEALRQRYAAEKLRFSQPEQRLVSHILVEVPADADAAAKAKAKAEAERIAALAKAPGADFAALAREHSDDTGSTGTGGDLGWVTPEGMVPEPFSKALFAMQPGTIAGPVETESGWHVIQLREVKPGAEIPFEEVRAQLAQEQLEADRERMFNEVTGKLVDQVYRNPNSLTSAAASANLPVQRSGTLVRGAGASGVAGNAAVQRAAFSEALVQDGTVSDPIELGPMHSVLIRVVAHEPERQRPLSEVASQVIAAVRKDRAAKAAEQAAEAMVAAVRGGKPLDEVAAGRQLAATSVPSLPRGMPMPTAEANEAIFSAPHPAGGKPSAGKVVLDDGRIVVYAVSKVTPGDPAEANEQQRKSLAEQLAGIAGNADVQGLVRQLRRQARVEVAEDRL